MLIEFELIAPKPSQVELIEFKFIAIALRLIEFKVTDSIGCLHDGIK